ncbi:MAG TPA: lipoyl(octanoyl) transferase LipB [Atribacteraceae bacterium]|nr:lipoyl(octanoyl) transferase LipB [Atribacteraceae bacterium]
MLTVPFCRLGQIEYQAARDIQLKIVELLFQRNNPGVLLLLEHPPVITLGKGATAGNLLASPSRLQEKGIAIHASERGGDITYHGPGQIVGYPLMNLAAWEKDIHRYLRALEEVLIRFLADLGIPAFRLSPHTGVWVGGKVPEKIAAIGVAVKRWVTYHGFALNIEPDLSHFTYIVPCGIRDRGVSSLAQLTGRTFSFSERWKMMESLADHFGSVFGFSVRETAYDRLLD